MKFWNWIRLFILFIYSVIPLEFDFHFIRIDISLPLYSYLCACLVFGTLHRFVGEYKISRLILFCFFFPFSFMSRWMKKWWIDQMKCWKKKKIRKKLAPEILIGIRTGQFIQYDHCVDWYSLGVVACRMLTNQVRTILFWFNCFCCLVPHSQFQIFMSSIIQGLGISNA